MLDRRGFLRSSLVLGAAELVGALSPALAAAPAFSVPPARIFAHRGFGTLGAPNALSPENTLAAFRRAAGLGITYLETDVQLTSDGVPVLMHDATVDRTTDGQGEVRDLPYARVAALNAAARFAPSGAPEPVPDFEAYLTLCRELGATAVPEMKAARRPEEVARLLAMAEAAGMADRVIWQSRRLASLREVARLRGPRARTALIRTDLKDFGEFSSMPGEKILILRATAITQDKVRPAEVREAGVKLAAWTVNQPGPAARLIEAGADFILSDGPV